MRDVERVKRRVAGALLRPPSRARFGAITFATLATHPIVWFVFPALGLGYATELVLSETYAAVAATIVYACLWPRVAWLRALAASAMANAASYVVGLGVASVPAIARAAIG